ncbi:hypothetical protein ACVDG5_032475 [Mesorhizobium sp. ORM6]
MKTTHLNEGKIVGFATVSRPHRQAPEDSSTAHYPSIRTNALIKVNRRPLVAEPAFSQVKAR